MNNYRKKSASLAAVVLCLLAAEPSFGKVLKDEQATLQLCREASERFNKPKLDSDAFFNTFKPYWNHSTEEIDNVLYQHRKSLEIVGERYGDEALGVVHHKTDKVNDIFLKHTFIIKRSKHALVSSCIFYNPKGNGWLLNTFFWNDEVTQLFY